MNNTAICHLTNPMDFHVDGTLDLIVNISIRHHGPYGGCPTVWIETNDQQSHPGQYKH